MDTAKNSEERLMTAKIEREKAETLVCLAKAHKIISKNPDILKDTKDSLSYTISTYTESIGKNAAIWRALDTL